MKSETIFTVHWPISQVSEQQPIAAESLQFLTLKDENQEQLQTKLNCFTCNFNAVTLVQLKSHYASVIDDVIIRIGINIAANEVKLIMKYFVTKTTANRRHQRKKMKN